MSKSPLATGAFAVTLVPVLLLLGCAQTNSHQGVSKPSLQAPANVEKPANFPGLHNVVDYAEGVYSGAAPEGDEGFTSLSALGVKTILSVDGTLPEVDKALRHGLHYVHLPIGYDGVPAERGKQIAAAIEKLGKPIYIHCHHGKHRSASATATACVIAGLMTPEAALARMQVSGTAAEYEGLFASARNARPLPLSELPAHPENFPASSKVSGTASTMTAVDNAFDELKIVRGEQWQVPKSHPDLLPAASAGQVHDLLSGLASDAECQQRPAGFHQLLQTSIAAAAALQQAIDKQDLEQCEARYSALNQSCKQCHKQFRDRR